MYSELLNKNTHNAIFIVEAVLNNLCEATVTELKKINGEDYLSKTFDTIKDTDIHVIRLKSNHEPVGLYGLIELSKTSAGIYLLTTDNLHKGNIIKFLREAKLQVNQWTKEYKLIMDNCYKKNINIQKWLLLLGFKPSEHQDENFQIYYKGDINEYN
jgi:hypothetical protein